MKSVIAPTDQKPVFLNCCSVGKYVSGAMSGSPAMRASVAPRTVSCRLSPNVRFQCFRNILSKKPYSVLRRLNVGLRVWASCPGASLGRSSRSWAVADPGAQRGVEGWPSFKSEFDFSTRICVESLEDEREGRRMTALYAAGSALSLGGCHGNRLKWNKAKTVPGKSKPIMGRTKRARLLCRVTLPHAVSFMGMPTCTVDEPFLPRLFGLLFNERV
mmetsp:Transcript_51571/g.142793  ORF Transcript_51571/g.142793 Transcript_51571/m.142793 type:complete len:216 (+) Transcript_51571:2483-3130(+)